MFFGALFVIRIAEQEDTIEMVCRLSFSIRFDVILT